VNLQLLLDFRNLDDASLNAHWMPILQSAGDEELFRSLYPKTTGQTVTDFLVFNPTNSNSIYSSIGQARENARMVRDQITAELWEEINHTYLFLNSPRAKQEWRQSPSDFFHTIRNSSLLLQGLTDSTVVRNEGWFFTQAGRYLERADKTSRILDVRHTSLPARGIPGTPSQTDALGWSAVLRSCSAL
jgi:uncharacterized alpha-E superfamily protein